MTARDRFYITLECPECGKKGSAEASQADGYAYINGDTATSIDTVPEGFKIVPAKNSDADDQVYCEECDVSARK